MKNNIRCLFETRRITLLAISIAALLLGRPTVVEANAIPTHFIDITENSSTSLTVLYDMADVTASVVALNSPDHWTLTFDPSIQFGQFNQFWTEPDNPTTLDNVVIGNGSNVLMVISDNPISSGLDQPDGTPQFNNGSVNQQPASFSITFHDTGDAAVGVPESASTLGLLFLSLVTLIGASRLRFGRFA